MYENVDSNLLYIEKPILTIVVPAGVGYHEASFGVA